MKEPERTTLINDIVLSYLELGNTLRMGALPSWITADLSLSQLKALVLLEYHGAMTVGELARLLEMGNPAASVLVQQMVQQGLVERAEDEKDRRRTFVQATAKGTGMLTSRREYIQTNLLRWLEMLSEDEVEGLRRGFEALMRVVQKEQERESQAVTKDLV
ncbi:MAG: MarR family transcriptional regulator [Chloroflexi bacterium]|nr:MAG: MarR family transcriptional regulator [Chloroflexota bacterium]